MSITGKELLWCTAFKNKVYVVVPAIIKGQTNNLCIAEPVVNRFFYVGVIPVDRDPESKTILYDMLHVR